MASWLQRRMQVASGAEHPDQTCRADLHLPSPQWPSLTFAAICPPPATEHVPIYGADKLQQPTRVKGSLSSFGLKVSSQLLFGCKKMLLTKFGIGTRQVKNVPTSRKKNSCSLFALLPVLAATL